MRCHNNNKCLEAASAASTSLDSPSDQVAVARKLSVGNNIRRPQQSVQVSVICLVSQFPTQSLTLQSMFI